MNRLAHSVSTREQWISAVGGLLGILAAVGISHLILGEQDAIYAVASIGASTVLLFAVPHGPLSQPWNLVGGHLVSAFIGVACAQWVPDTLVAASLAVSLSILAMFPLRCIHPPGGATALYAVLGGTKVHALGYLYILSPVMINVLILLAVAVAFNYPFSWRRYPQTWSKAGTQEEKAMIPHSHLVYALSQIDTFVDISESDLQRIYSLAMDEETASAKAD